MTGARRVGMRARAHRGLVLLWGLLLCWPLAAQPTERAWVSWVIDGDTLVLVPEDGSPAWTLRLTDLDAPERCQPGGEAARQALVVLVHRRWVLAERRTQDVYGRWLGRLWREGQDVGGALVRQGWAWAQDGASGRGPYGPAQALAQSEGLGVFAASEPPMRPRVFRRFHGSCQEDGKPGAPVQRKPAQTGH